jgi:hypothetical protein
LSEYDGLPAGRPQGNVERNAAVALRQAQHGANRRLRKCGFKLEGRIEMFVTERLRRARLVPTARRCNVTY